MLVASTDGVGTKLLVAAELKRYDTIGRDLVNHCVNDILCLNANPLFFLDYLAVGLLDPAVAAQIVGGVGAACAEHQMALLGGETAEMPGSMGRALREGDDRRRVARDSSFLYTADSRGAGGRCYDPRHGPHHGWRPR